MVRSLLALHASAGNGAVSELLVQRMIWLPFEEMDPALVKFASGDAPSRYPGPRVQASEPSGKVGKHEDIVVIAHGNGVSISNWDDASHRGYEQLQADELAPRLRKLLPSGYRGSITVWACQAARPWKHVPGVAEQLSGDEDVDVDATLAQSYIRLLHAQLEAVGIRPEQVVGPVGFITTDRKPAAAKVFADEQDLILGNTLPAFAAGGGGEHGLVHAGETPPEDFYAAYMSDEDDDFGGEQQASSEGESEEEGSTDMEVEPRATTPAFHSKEEYLEAVMRPAPFGQGGGPPSLKERLRRLEQTKRK